MQSDLENVIKEKYKLQEQIEHLNDDIASIKDNHSGEISQQEGEKSKLEQKLRDANHKIKSLESQKADFQKQSEKEVEDLNSRINSVWCRFEMPL